MRFARYLRYVLAMTMLSSGCGESSPPPAGQPGRAVTSLADIAGRWDIARFDGYVPMRLHEGVRRAFVDVGRDGLSYVIECNYSGNSARIDRAGVLHDTGDGSRMSTLMRCSPEREAREAALFAFFASRPKVSWRSDGQLGMFGSGSELILERPERRRLAHIASLAELAGRWVPQMSLRLTDGNGHEGWGFQEPEVLTVASENLIYSGCGGVRFPFRYGREGQLETVADKPESSCGSDGPGSALLTVLTNDPLVERMEGGGLALTAGLNVITLQREETLERMTSQPLPFPAGKTIAIQAPPPPAPGKD